MRLTLRLLHRLALPLAILAGGIASFVYGMKSHVLPVIEEREEEAEISIPMPFTEQPGGSPFGDPSAGQPGEPGIGPPGEGGNEGGGQEGGPPPFAPPFMQPPPMLKQKVTRTIETTKDVPELTLIHEVSVGGVARSETGELIQTYSGEAGPALCPS